MFLVVASLADLGTGLHHTAVRVSLLQLDFLAR